MNLSNNRRPEACAAGQRRRVSAGAIENPRRRAVLLVFALWIPGCSAPEDPFPLEGVTYDGEQVFRGVDLPGVAEDAAFEELVRLAKLHFGSGSMFVDAENRTLMLRRNFSGVPRRVTFYGQVVPTGGGSRVEVFTRLEELPDRLEGTSGDPWVAADPDRDFKLENVVLQWVREDLLYGAPESAGSEPPSG